MDPQLKHELAKEMRRIRRRLHEAYVAAQYNSDHPVVRQLSHDFDRLHNRWLRLHVPEGKHCTPTGV